MRVLTNKQDRRDDLDLSEPPKVPHRWSLTTRVCVECGITRMAIMDFPNMRECTPFAKFPTFAAQQEVALSPVQ